MPDLEQQFAEWRRQMAAGGIKSSAVLDELESHLREDVERQLRAGLDAQQVFEIAVQRIGQASTLKTEFENARGTMETRLRKYLWRASAIGAGLFVTGVSLCYFVLLPPILQANRQYAAWLGREVPQWPSGAYVGFICKLMFGVGAAFAMPVAWLTLVKIGVLDHRKLVGLRRYVIVVNLIVGAMATTPEVMTQITIFIPLQLVYEVSVWIAWYSEHQARSHA